jgi:hypothetical protein
MGIFSDESALPKQNERPAFMNERKAMFVEDLRIKAKMGLKIPE